MNGKKRTILVAKPFRKKEWGHWVINPIVTLVKLILGRKKGV